jgi:hypothetical protein
LYEETPVSSSTKEPLPKPDPDSLTWRKSSLADPDGYVEVAFANDGTVAVRNGKNPQGTILVFTPEEWDAFILGAKDDEFTI